ncbi:DUF4290 domain-containing protein [Thermoflexibacter ruber]|uniref:DUF4290 domain-containing protein n=1 Tax=Thermoflexibacter ruber TaxID=1003 RepID=A0A1I2ETC9_9BACT|nr:DUF4290 domain-containing protein [Thermoflexibacter ruber]SFE96069.1 protein of unknown function [Thermoflexibacter ruber]
MKYNLFELRMEKDYNTQKTPLILKEYGRNVQKLVEYIATLSSKEERTRYAHTLISLMKQLNPSVREHNDNAQRIWDHLFLMSDFNLDIDSPYPIPERSILHKKPKSMTYRVGEVTYKHYGRNIEILITKAAKITEPEEKQQAMSFIFKLMKSFYASWNKETVDDITIANQLRELSKGQLSIDLQAMRSEAHSHGERGDREHHKDRNRNNNNNNSRKKNKDRKRK